MWQDDPAARAAMRSSRPASRGAVRAYDWIAHHRAHRPTKEAVRELASQRSHSYADLDRRADALAAYLASLGIGRGDRVALLAHNGVEYFDLQFACARNGAIAVLLNWRLTVSELEYILGDSAPRLLIHDVEFGDSARTLQARCGLPQLLCIDGGVKRTVSCPKRTCPSRRPPSCAGSGITSQLMSGSTHAISG